MAAMKSCENTQYAYAILLTLLPKMRVHRDSLLKFYTIFHSIILTYLIIIFYILLFITFKKKAAASRSVCSVYVVKKIRIFVFLFWNTMKQTHPSNQTFKVKKKSISSVHLNPKTKKISPAGNRTPVSSVTDGDTHHYTTEELDALD